MDYKKVYTEDYFSGKNSFFYSHGYENVPGPYFSSMYRPLKPYLAKIQRGKVLDVGCAYGFMLEKFPDTFEKYGIDVSEHAILEARKRLPDALLTVGGAEEKLPFPDDYFDVIMTNDVLEHLENPKAALEQMCRVLKTGGILYINIPNLNWARRTFFADADRKEHHISLMTRVELLDMVKELGFTVINHWTFITFPFFFFPSFRSNMGIETACVIRKN